MTAAEREAVVAAMALVIDHALVNPRGIAPEIMERRRQCALSRARAALAAAIRAGGSDE